MGNMQDDDFDGISSPSKQTFNETREVVLVVHRVSFYFVKWNSFYIGLYIIKLYPIPQATLKLGL